MKSVREVIASTMQAHTKIKVFFGFDKIDEIKRMNKAKEPFVYMDHAYFKRGYHYENYRVCWCDVHQRTLLDVPGDRKEKFGIAGKLRDWKQGDKVILIPAAPNPESFYQESGWTDRTRQTLSRFTDREIVVKHKGDGNLREHLLKAWCVVSHSSVAGVEAATWGVPVFGPDTSPATPVGLQDLSKLEQPIFPDREQWIRTLTYSQFHISEMKSGEAWDIFRNLHGA